MNCARLLALAAAALLLAGAALAADECLKAEPNCAPGKCNPDAPEFCDQCKLDWVFGDDGLCRAPNCKDNVDLQCATCAADNPNRCATCLDATWVLDAATGGCVAASGPGGDCTADAAKGCATCLVANPQACATCATDGWTVDAATGACVDPASPAADCTTDTAKGCATCDAADPNRCATCTDATFVVDATTGDCRAKTCDDFPAKGCATCAADAPESCATCTQAGFIVQGGACVTPPMPGPDCTADATKGCATCSAADALKCATCTQAGYVVSTAGVCVPPAPAGQACPSSRSGGWWYGRHYGAWQTNSYRLCSSCDAAGKCLACTLPDWHVVDATTGRCRAKNCVERDAECASCGWKDRCAACKQPGWTVNWYTGKCAAPVAAPVPTCLAADANCAACKIWNPALCRVCKPGYDLAWTGKCVTRTAGGGSWGWNGWTGSSWSSQWSNSWKPVKPWNKPSNSWKPTHKPHKPNKPNKNNKNKWRGL